MATARETEEAEGRYFYEKGRLDQGAGLDFDLYYNLTHTVHFDGDVVVTTAPNGTVTTAGHSFDNYFAEGTANYESEGTWRPSPDSEEYVDYKVTSVDGFLYW